MEKAFPQVALGRRGWLTSAVQITEPFAVNRIGEVLVAPIVDLLMPTRVFFFARQFVGHECCDDCFIVRPPKLHILPVFLNRLAA